MKTVGVLLMGYWLTAIAIGAQGNSEVPIDVKAEIRREGKSNIILYTTLKNSSSNSITLWNVDLPWGHFRNMIVVVVPLSQPTPLKEWFSPSNPIWEEVTLKSGESTSGEVRLSHKFPNLGRALSRTNVLLFWSYQANTVDEKVLVRQGGQLIIPKNANKSATTK